jgi:hypothetical protein
LTASLANGSATTQLSQSTTALSNVSADYAVLPAAKSTQYVPSFLVRLLRSLPLIGHADFVKALESSRLRWSPVAIRLSSGFSGSRADVETFRVPIATTSDTLATTVHTVAAALRSQASVELRPLESASLSIHYADTRDLKDYGDSTTIGALARGVSRRFLGLNMGFERERSLATVFSYAPSLFSWLRPRFSTSSSFAMTRDPNASVPERTRQDSAGGYRLPTAFVNARSSDLSASVDLSRALKVLFGDSAKILALLDRFIPLDVATHSDARAQFDRPGFDPGLGFQLGLGGGGFRKLNGVLAVSASNTRQVRLSSGLRMPLGFSVVAAYAQRSQHTWSRRLDAQSEVDQGDTQWPDVTGRWVWTPPRLLRTIVTSVSASGGLRVSTAETVQPPFQVEVGASAVTLDEVRSTQETRSWPVSLTVTWAPHITTNLSLTESRGTSLQAGNSTLTSHQDLTANVSFAFRPPKQYLPLPSDVRTALRYASSSDQACIVLAAGGACVGISQSSRHQFNLSMDTEMPPNVSAGLSIGYILTEDAHIDRRFSQVVITASVTVNFQSGAPR